MSTTRPNIMSRQEWERQRLNDIRNAIKWYLDEGLTIPLAWIEEYNDLLFEDRRVRK